METGVKERVDSPEQRVSCTLNESKMSQKNDIKRSSRRKDNALLSVYVSLDNKNIT